MYEGPKGFKEWITRYAPTSQIFGGFIPSSTPSTKSSTQPKTIRCFGCGGRYELSGDFIDSLSEDETDFVKFPCRYECKVRVREIRKRLKNV